jgi:hypothetical protein
MKSKLECNIDLDWNKDDKLCRDLVENDPLALAIHMITKHGWQNIPQSAFRECKTEQDKKDKLDLYSKNGKEWWIDNQIIWTEFRKHHFRRQSVKSNVIKEDCICCSSIFPAAKMKFIVRTGHWICKDCFSSVDSGVHMVQVMSGAKK